MLNTSTEFKNVGNLFMMDLTEVYHSIEHGRINHGRVEPPIKSYWKDSTIQKKRRFWSVDEIYAIHRQMDFLSRHSKAYPQVDSVVKSDSCDQANEGEQLREIELLCEPGLPEGWEQCLDLETGEFFFIDKSCGKRTKRDPRPILVEANKNIHALWCSHSLLVDEDGSTPSNNSYQDSRSSSSTVSCSMHILRGSMECSQSTDHDGKLPILKACSKCLLYFLIAREVEKCPSCKTSLFGV